MLLDDLLNIQCRGRGPAWGEMISLITTAGRNNEQMHLSDQTSIDHRINKQPIKRREKHPLTSEGSGLAVCGCRSEVRNLQG